MQCVEYPRTNNCYCYCVSVYQWMLTVGSLFTQITLQYNSSKLDLPNSLLSADVERSFLIGRSMREKLELSETTSVFLFLLPFNVVRVRAEANRFVRFGESWAPGSTSSVGVRGSSSSLSEQPAGSSARPSEKGPWPGAT